MDDDSHVMALLEQILDTGCAPEEACRESPELLPIVRKRLNRFRTIEAEVAATFPSRDESSDYSRSIIDRTARALPQIPGYEVEGVVGSGGMGIVYKARHRRLNRIVAIKMLLAGGYAGPRELERFKRESEVIAALQHANVVQVYDAGEYDGFPYFAMEFMDGGRLAEKLAGAPQPARDAAETVATLARAVYAAHERGIVHRDLKPGNILLTMDGTLKIADFGLARRFDTTEEATLTIAAARIGTPSYMSPEQARGSDGAFGPAVDVYALGAILYEMLTGRPPFRGESPADTERQVISEEPIAPIRLNPRTPRDLETICLKCLQKAPGHRYETAAALADDLDRFLRGEPIRARPVGRVERTWRWCRRNPAAVVIAVILAIAATISTREAVRSSRAEAGARRSEQQALHAAAAEKFANEETKKRLGQVQKANDILATVFENLDPEQVAKSDRPLQAILADKLDQAVELLAGDSTGDPLVVANIQEKLGFSLIGLGKPRKAIVLFERAYATRLAMQGPTQPQTLFNLDLQAKAYQADGQMDKALRLEEKAVELMRIHLPPNDDNTVNSICNLCLMYQQVGRASSALPLQEENLRHMIATHADQPDTLAAMNNLAITYMSLGKLDQAIPLFEKTLGLRKAKLGPNHPNTLNSMNNLARAYDGAGKPEQAQQLLEETLRIRKATLGPDHPDTLAAMKNIDFHHGIHTAQERYRSNLAKLGPDHTDTLLAHRDLAHFYLTTNRLDEAEHILVDVVDRMKDRSADDQVRVFTIGLLQACLTKREGTMPDSWLTFKSKSLVGDSLMGLKKYTDAEPLLLSGYEGMKKRAATIPANEAARLTEAGERLVKLYEAMGKEDEVVKWRRELR